MQTAGKFYKRLWRIILVTVIMALLLCSLSSCGQPKSAGDGGESGIGNGTESIHAGSGELSWRARHVTLDRQYASAAVSEDMLYGVYYEGDGAVVDYLRKDYGDTLEVSAEKQVPLTGIFYVQKMFCDSVGNVYVFGLDEKDYSSLWRIDPEENVQTVWDVPGEEASKGSEEEITYPEPKAVFEGEDGSIYIWYSLDIPVNNIHYGWERIYKLNPKGEVLFYAQVYNRSYISILKDGSGELLFLQKDEEGLYTQAMDPQSGELKEAVRLKEGEDLKDDYPFIVPEEGAFLFCEGTFSYGLEGELYEFRLDTQKRETVLDLSAFGIHGEDMLCLDRIGGGIEVIDNPTEQGNSEFTLLEHGEWKEEDEIVLTLALREEKIASSLDEIVTAFNRERTDIRVEILDYSGDEYNAVFKNEQLNLEFVTGTAPDILEGFGDQNLRPLAMNGALADMYGLMEGDEELNRDSFLDSILTGFEVQNALYYIAPLFQMKSLCGRASLLGEGQELTLGDLLQILADSGKGAEAVSGLAEDVPLTLETGVPGTNASELFYAGMDEYIDWDAGTCHFESDGFLELLEFAKEYYDTKHKYADPKSVRQGDVLVTQWGISKVADYQIAEELFEEKVSFIGFPAGGKSTGIMMSGAPYLAINAKCEHPKEAWEFVKYVLLHYRDYNLWAFPVIREQFEETLEQSMVQEYWPGEDGKPDPNKPKLKATRGQGPDEIKVYAATKEDVDAVRKLAEKVSGRYGVYRDVLAIINEDISYYFAGQKSAEEVAKIIQSRISLWLQEQM